jgi:hypothetical protein
MDVYEFAKDAWYPSKEILVVSVGYIGLPELRAYHAYLRQGCEVTPGSTIVLGDQEAAGWDELGLDIEATKHRLEEGIEVIRRNER